MSMFNILHPRSSHQRWEVSRRDSHLTNGGDTEDEKQEVFSSWEESPGLGGVCLEWNALPAWGGMRGERSWFTYHNRLSLLANV